MPRSNHNRSSACRAQVVTLLENDGLAWKILGVAVQRAEQLVSDKITKDKYLEEEGVADEKLRTFETEADEAIRSMNVA